MLKSTHKLTCFTSLIPGQLGTRFIKETIVHYLYRRVR